MSATARVTHISVSRPQELGRLGRNLASHEYLARFRSALLRPLAILGDSTSQSESRAV